MARAPEVAMLLSLGVGKFGLPAQAPGIGTPPAFACLRSVIPVQQATGDFAKVVV